MRLFPFDSPPYRRLVKEFRRRTFEDYAEHGASGLIFTFVWLLDDADDRSFVEETIAIFGSHGSETCFVELTASQPERLRRNTTPLRLSEKWPQRNLEGSRQFLLDADRNYMMNTSGEFFYPERHLKIDNTELEPDEVARRIVAHFALPPAATTCQ